MRFIASPGAHGERRDVDASIDDADKVAEVLIRCRKDLDPQTIKGSQECGIPDGTQGNLFNNLMMYRSPTSQFLHITAQGVDDVTDVRCEVEAVVDRQTLTIVEWERK